MNYEKKNSKINKKNSKLGGGHASNKKLKKIS